MYKYVKCKSDLVPDSEAALGTRQVYSAEYLVYYFFFFCQTDNFKRVKHLSIFIYGTFVRVRK